jgi:HlyD family secretion protein
MIKNCVGAVFLLTSGGVLLVGATACERTEASPPGYQGIVELDERDAAFAVGGRLERLFVERGQSVSAGVRIAVLDDALETSALEARNFEAEAAHAQVALLRAGARPEEIREARALVRAVRAREESLRTTLDREQKLLASGVSTQAAFDEVKGKLASAVAERESAEQRVRALESGAREQEISVADARARAAGAATAVERERIDRLELVSPVSGVVVDVHAEPGEVVAAGAPVATVADTQHPYADVFVPQGEISGIVVGLPAKAAIDSSPRPISGRVEHVSERIEFTPRFVFSPKERDNLMLRVRVRLEATPEQVPAGVPVFVTIERKRG